MRREKKTVLTNGKATTMKDLHEARWTDRERDKFLDRFNPYEVDDSVDGVFSIDIATEDAPLILVDHNDKKYAAYLDFAAKGHFHGEDFVDVDRVKCSIFNLIVDDYSADLVEHDKWLDRIDEQGTLVVAERDIQDEALLHDLHLADGRSIEDAMKDITEVAVNEQWGDGSYDIDELDGETIVDFYPFNYVDKEDFVESSKKPTEPRIKESGSNWHKTYTYELENDLDAPLKAYDGEQDLDLYYTIECTVDYNGDDDNTDGDLRDYKILAYEIAPAGGDFKETIYVDKKDFDKKEVKEYLDKITIINGDRKVPLKDYMEDLAHNSVDDHAYEFDLDYDDYVDPADEYADANYDAWRDSQY